MIANSPSWLRYSPYLIAIAAGFGVSAAFIPGSGKGDAAAVAEEPPVPKTELQLAGEKQLEEILAKVGRANGVSRKPGAAPLPQQAAGDAFTGSRNLTATTRLGASEILAKVSKDNPKLSAEEATSEVFRGIFSRDPERAYGLLDGRTDVERSKIILAAAQNERDPRQIYRLFTAVPYKQSMGPLQQRFSVWSKVSRSAYATYGDDYPDWVMALPAGSDRDMALSALAIDFEKSEPERAAAWRAAKTPEPKH